MRVASPLGVVVSGALIDVCVDLSGRDGMPLQDTNTLMVAKPKKLCNDDAM